ncbi:response regulator transcription factor [Fictibacillus aquaticus]|uniref:DNA-binding response regulator n=1 Tax=Fictibacillus aquaticus TaxID=2021314 RepID=A0A235F6N6_9BACL|nr:response regulator transcription factor [Fictibacillus aquaticus]OYD56912.1 DNA-binding response regulator [Fictibacillus aquaticus]
MELKGKSILIVEDDPKIRNLMKIYLENSGYETYLAEDGEEGKKAFKEIDPCFMIVDLMMPKLSGEKLTEWIRNEQKSEIPLIMVTAKSDEKDRIAGLQSGADDYVTKPFSPGELVARVEAVLRRTVHRCNKISYKGLTIKPFKGEVTYKGESIALTPNEFKLLYKLMRHPNQILKRDQLLDEMYPNHEKTVNDRTVDVHLVKLREKIERNDDITFIETVRGMGYRFVSF